MKNILMLLGLALAVVGCSRAEDDWPEYTAGSGDLARFTVDSAIKLGARLKSTNAVAEIPAEWHYKALNDRVQVVLTGNHFLELQTILTNAFGPLPNPPVINERSMGASFGPEVGADIRYSWDKLLVEGKEYTTLIIAKAQKAPQDSSETNKAKAKPTTAP